MIVGIGIDMIEVDRVGEKIGKPTGFKEKIFSPGEIAFCDAQSNREENYAARFAAKEAFLKATGQGLNLGFGLAEIEIVNDDLGKPSIVLHGDVRRHAQKNYWNRIHVTLTHLKSVACAMVVIEQ